MTLRRLRFQQLEHGYALAGDVTAVIVDGDLFLTGDASANELRVNQMANGFERGGFFAPPDLMMRLLFPWKVAHLAPCNRRKTLTGSLPGLPSSCVRTL